MLHEPERESRPPALLARFADFLATRHDERPQTRRHNPGAFFFNLPSSFEATAAGAAGRRAKHGAASGTVRKASLLSRADSASSQWHNSLVPEKRTLFLVRHPRGLTSARIVAAGRIERHSITLLALDLRYYFD